VPWPPPKLDFPIFDADNHLYEAREALTQYLPVRYKAPSDFAEVHGPPRSWCGAGQRLHPQTHLRSMGRPGALAEYFQHGNAEGRSMKEMIGRASTARPPSERPAPPQPHG